MLGVGRQSKELDTINNIRTERNHIQKWTVSITESKICLKARELPVYTILYLTKIVQTVRLGVFKML